MLKNCVKLRRSFMPLIAGLLTLACNLALPCAAQGDAEPAALANRATPPTASGSADGMRWEARFFYPRALALDAQGQIWVADSSNHSIRRIRADGQVSTVAGAAGQPGSADGAAAQARFYFPRALVPDTHGGLWIGDSSNHTIRYLSAQAQVRTVVGMAGQKGSADGVGSAARLDSPNGLALDAAGRLYVADYGNHTIRRLDPKGKLITLAGAAGQKGSADGLGSAARFASPNGVAVDAAGFVYVADTHNHTIRRISPNGLVTTLAGSAGQSGMADGVGEQARLNAPRGIAVDAQGQIWVADNNNHRLRRLRRLPASTAQTEASPPQYLLETIAGSTAGAPLYYPRGVAVDAQGYAFVADTYHHAIARVSPSGQVQTWAGAPYSGEPPQPAPNYVLPSTSEHSAYASDAEHGRIYRRQADGSWAVWLERSAGLLQARGMAWGQQGEIFVADSGGHSILSIDPSSGQVRRIAGVWAQAGAQDGAVASAVDGAAPMPAPTPAQFSQPMAVVQAHDGRLYVADSGNHAIRCIDLASGQVSTVAGRLGQAGAQDGVAGASRWNSPSALALSPQGDALLVADSGNHAIRRIDLASGQVRTIAGALGQEGRQDGIGRAARFAFPRGLAVDAQGDIWIADSLNHSVRRIDAVSGQVSTPAGLAGQAGQADGVGSAARFFYPRGISVDAQGQIWLADSLNASLRRMVYGGAAKKLEVSTEDLP